MWTCGRIRYLFGATALAAMTSGCSLEGHAYDPDDSQRRFGDMEVMLVRASPDFMREVTSACSTVKAAEAKREAEATRLEQAAMKLRMEAGRLAQRGLAGTPAWERLLQRAQLVDDSASAVAGYAPLNEPDVSEIVAKYIAATTRTDVEGRFAFSRVSRGSYFVVPESREPYRFGRWHPIEVGLFGGSLDLTGRDASSVCWAVGAEWR